VAGTATIGRRLQDAAGTWSDRLWLVDDHRAWTFADLAVGAERVARALLASAVGQGDPVGVFASNRAEWFVFELGAALIGAPVVPLNTRFTAAELGQVLSRVGVRALLWEGSLRGKDAVGLLGQVLAGQDHALADGAGEGPGRAAGGAPVVVGLGDGPWPPSVATWADFLDRADGIGDRAFAQARERVQEDATGLIVFTSGTTGAPKGAMLRQGGIVAHMRTWARHLGFTGDDRAILASPVFWGFGCVLNAVVPLLAGSSIVLHDGFDARAWLTDIGRWSCTYLQGVPSQYQLLLDHPQSEDFDLSGIRLVQIGGAPSADVLVRRLRRRAPGAVLVSAYGLTEGGFVNTATDLGDPDELVLSTVGRALPDNEAAVRPLDRDEDCPSGEVGELCLRGPHLMTGYLGDPVATAQTLRGGWLRTGDLATMDRGGYLRIVGRVKDMFITGGMNVYPAEVENVLAGAPGVALGAVAGVPDDRMGEVGVAWVVAEAGASLEEAELLAHLRTRLADYKVPRRVCVVDELPMSASGKVAKLELVERWSGGDGAGP